MSFAGKAVEFGHLTGLSSVRNRGMVPNELRAGPARQSGLTPGALKSTLAHFTGFSRKRRSIRGRCFPALR